MISNWKHHDGRLPPPYPPPYDGGGEEVLPRLDAVRAVGRRREPPRWASSRAATSNCRIHAAAARLLGGLQVRRRSLLDEAAQATKVGTVAAARKATRTTMS